MWYLNWYRNKNNWAHWWLTFLVPLRRSLILLKMNGSSEWWCQNISERLDDSWILKLIITIMIQNLTKQAWYMNSQWLNWALHSRWLTVLWFFPYMETKVIAAFDKQYCVNTTRRCIYGNFLHMDHFPLHFLHCFPQKSSRFSSVQAQKNQIFPLLSNVIAPTLRSCSAWTFGWWRCRA